MSKHIHKFTIPFEYAFLDYRPRFHGTGPVTVTATAMRLEKVMCVCGEVKEVGEYAVWSKQ